MNRRLPEILISPFRERQKFYYLFGEHSTSTKKIEESYALGYVIRMPFKVIWDDWQSSKL